MIFLNSASSVAALVFYLPHTDTERKQIKASWNILKSSKNTIFNEHPVAYNKGNKVSPNWLFINEMPRGIIMPGVEDWKVGPGLSDFKKRYPKDQ